MNRQEMGPRVGGFVGLCALAAGLSMAAPSARADYNYGDLGTWNLVVVGRNLGAGNDGSYQVGSDVEGRALIGGNVIGSNAGPIGVRLQGISSFNNVDTFVVAGNINHQVQVQNGNGVASTTALANNFLLNGVGSKLVDSGLSDLSTRLANDLNAASANYLALAAGGQTVVAPGSPSALTFTTSALNTHDGVAVFNIAGSLLGNSNVQQLVLDNSFGAASIIFNVSGTSISIGANGTNISSNGAYGFGTQAGSVLFNFYQATTITDATAFYGAILAPNAALSNTTQINGPVYVNSFYQSGEVHLPTQTFNQQPGFGPNTPLTTGTINAVPEPSSLALSAIGGIGLALAAWRRRRSA